MQTHIIKNGVVVNTIVATVAEAQAAYPDATCVDATAGGIGWTWDGTTLAAPIVVPPEPTVPQSVTMRHPATRGADRLSSDRGLQGRLPMTPRFASALVKFWKLIEPPVVMSVRDKMARARTPFSVGVRRLFRVTLSKVKTAISLISKKPLKKMPYVAFFVCA